MVQLKDGKQKEVQWTTTRSSKNKCSTSVHIVIENIEQKIAITPSPFSLLWRCDTPGAMCTCELENRNRDQIKQVEMCSAQQISTGTSTSDNKSQIKQACLYLRPFCSFPICNVSHLVFWLFAFDQCYRCLKSIRRGQSQNEGPFVRVMAPKGAWTFYLIFNAMFLFSSWFDDHFLAHSIIPAHKMKELLDLHRCFCDNLLKLFHQIHYWCLLYEICRMENCNTWSILYI